MPIQTKNLTDVVDKWKSRSQQSAKFYADGVQGKGDLWSSQTLDAVQTYNEGVQQAIANNSFQRGVQSAGPSAFERGVRDKGTQRWAPGIAASEDKYSNKMRAVLDVIGNVELPPRGPRGSAQNYQRVEAVGRALSEARQDGRL